MPDLDDTLKDIGRQFGEITSRCAERGETIARHDEHMRNQNGSLKRIDETLLRLEQKFDEREEDSAQVIRELDRHVWGLLIKVGIGWTLLNAAILVGLGYFITQALGAQ